MEWGTRSTYIVYMSAVTVSAIIGLFTRRRGIIMAMGLLLLVWSNALTFCEQGVLGAW